MFKILSLAQNGWHGLWFMQEQSRRQPTRSWPPRGQRRCGGIGGRFEACTSMGGVGMISSWRHTLLQGFAPIMCTHNGNN